MLISKAYNEDGYETLLREADASIDLFLQDTPFEVTQNSWDIKPDFKKMWPEWLRVGKENAAFIFFATQKFAVDIILSQPSLFKYDLIWYKSLGSGFLNAKRQPMRNHESILIFYRKQPTYNPQKTFGVKKTGKRLQNDNGTNYGAFTLKDDQRKYNNEGINYPQSVIDVSNGDRTNEQDHPTQKPLQLIRYLIRTYSNPGDTVFDGYLGSGTTRIAAWKENRNFIGAEMDTEHGYFKKQEQRFKDETSQLVLL